MDCRGKDPTVRTDLARTVARLWEERLVDAREAADAWRRVLRMKAGDPEATEGLDRAKSNMLKRSTSDAPLSMPAGDGGTASKISDGDYDEKGGPNASAEVLVEAKSAPIKADAPTPSSNPSVSDESEKPEPESETSLQDALGVDGSDSDAESGLSEAESEKSISSPGKLERTPSPPANRGKGEPPGTKSGGSSPKASPPQAPGRRQPPPPPPVRSSARPPLPAPLPRGLGGGRALPPPPSSLRPNAPPPPPSPVRTAPPPPPDVEELEEDGGLSVDDSELLD